MKKGEGNMGKEKKSSSAEKVEKGISELYHAENRQLLLVTKIQRSNHLQGINYYAAIDKDGVEIYQENKSFQHNVVKVDRIEWKDWSSVSVDHYFAKSIFEFKGDSSTWNLVVDVKGKEVVQLIKGYTNIQVNELARPWYKKILGFRSGKKWKMITASIIYLVIFSNIISAFTSSDSETTQTQSTPEQTVTTSAPAPSEQQDNEAKKKAEEEAKKKAEEEAKQKAAEEAKRKAEEAKTKNAIFAQLTIPNLSNGLKLQDKTYNFIVANSDIFPAKTEAQIKKARNMIDSKIKFGHLEKNINPYLDKMISFSGNVVSVEEQTLDTGETVALVHLLDNNFNSYRTLIMKSTGDIIKGDKVRIIGVPVGNEAFSNVAGGTTKAVFVFGSHINKLQ